MTNFHGWTDGKSYVIVTAGRSKRYGIAKLGKKDTFDLLKGTQVALLRMFLTPKTLSSKPTGQPFEAEVSPCNLYYEVWRCLICYGYMDVTLVNGEETSWGIIFDMLAANVKVAITQRAPGIELGYGFWGHPDYTPGFKEIEKTLFFFLMNTEPNIVENIIGEVAKSVLSPDAQLCNMVEPYLPEKVSTSTALADEMKVEIGFFAPVRIILSGLRTEQNPPVEEVNCTLMIDTKALAAADVVVNGASADGVVVDELSSGSMQAIDAISERAS
jgi:hypothetical protein